eukprot:g2666.t1
MSTLCSADSIRCSTKNAGFSRNPAVVRCRPYFHNTSHRPLVSVYSRQEQFSVSNRELVVKAAVSDADQSPTQVENPVTNKKLRIKLKSFDVPPIRDAVDMILAAARETGAKISGPIPLPTRRRLYCVLRSPHVNKDSREHFEIRTHSRLIEIQEMSSETIDRLMELDIPAGSLSVHSDFKSEVLYRGRSLNDVFLRRAAYLIGGLLMTYHSDEDKEPTNTWYITPDCVLQPIVRRTINVAQDNWTALAARILCRTYTVRAYMIRLSWLSDDPTTTPKFLVLGFDSIKTAAHWRDTFREIINSNVPLKGPNPVLPTLIPNSESLPIKNQEHLNGTPVEEQDCKLTMHNWCAIKELHGMVVKYEEDTNGGAYMVSSLIKACPNDCFKALTTGSFLFSCGDVSLVRREDGIEVLHLQLQPAGLGSWLLTPRELVIERVCTKHPSGDIVVLFKSCNQPITGNTVCQSWWSWFTKPIRAHIHAAVFTISPVHLIDGKIDSKLNLVLKIDLGGICSSNHLFKPLLDEFGICEYWIDRILLTVAVIKQRLETQKTKINSVPSSLSAFLPQDGLLFKNHNLCTNENESSFISREDSLPRNNGVLNNKFWSDPGSTGFFVRGETYFFDKRKVPADQPRFFLDWVYLVKLKAPTHDIARFLPALRSGNDDFTFVLQVMIPGPPHLSMIIGWTRNQKSQNSDEGSDTSADTNNRDPFEISLLRFLKSDNKGRNGMFKLIPKVVEGNWIIRNSVGHTPVLMGRKLRQTYHTGAGYFELDIDISSSKTASAVIGIVQGATKKLTVDLAILIQGDNEEELPESLLGTVRLDHVDLETAEPLEHIIRN